MNLWISAILSAHWMWPYLSAKFLLFGVFTPLFWWYSYRRAQARIVADSRLIRRVYVMYLVGIEVAGLPAFLGASVDPGSLSVGDALVVLVGRLTLVALVVGMMILFSGIWLEWRAQRQGRWRLRA